MAQLPAPVVQAYDKSSSIVSDLTTWGAAQLYSLAGIFYGILLGVFIETKGLLIKTKESVDDDENVKQFKGKAKEAAQNSKEAVTSGYTNATGETPRQTQQKLQQTANNAKHDAKQATQR